MKAEVLSVDTTKKIAALEKENKSIKEANEKAKIEISILMSKYFYDDYVIEDTDLDLVLKILDGAYNE